MYSKRHSREELPFLLSTPLMLCLHSSTNLTASMVIKKIKLKFHDMVYVLASGLLYSRALCQGGCSSLQLLGGGGLRKSIPLCTPRKAQPPPGISKLADTGANGKGLKEHALCTGNDLAKK